MEIETRVLSYQHQDPRPSLFFHIFFFRRFFLIRLTVATSAGHFPYIACYDHGHDLSYAQTSSDFTSTSAIQASSDITNSV
jgi:hypothetical protein